MNKNIIKNQQINFFLLIILLIFLQQSVQEKQEVFEPEKNICNGKCLCKNESDSLILDCSYKNLTHILNKWPPHKNHLRVSFSGNNFSELQQMPVTEANTISLTFSHCGIKTLEYAIFIDAIGIQFLDLSWNLLSGQELRADVFRGRYNKKAYEPIALEELILSHNKIESLSHTLFEHTPNITRLDLSYNPFNIIDIQTAHAISSLEKLSILNLANTSITTFPDQMISRLLKLRELDLSKNLIIVVPMDLGFVSKSLEILKFGENPIRILDDESFMGLHLLKELNISAMPELHTIKHNTFSNLLNLKVVNCSNNPKLNFINHQAFGIKSNRPPITELYLSNNNLETLYPDQLEWSTLSVLDLSNNKWLCNCDLFNMLQQVNDTNNEIITADSMCSQPFNLNGVYLTDLKTIGNFCNATKSTVIEVTIQSRGTYVIFMKMIMILACIFLILLACYTFWRILLKYKTIRSINTAYPVIYVSAPTSEY